MYIMNQKLIEEFYVRYCSIHKYFIKRHVEYINSNIHHSYMNNIIKHSLGIKHELIKSTDDLILASVVILCLV